ncbi:MAG: hypothetical protein KAR35_04775 [Candidatus Heimdallarchaeota archaeon]|nr:hypothetical protein [Candidatus Heimdallarchaeota archaeon]MCK5048669.1 hypothetical protein [Candidatus Heimdallarchaeota archaeon]
MPPNSCKICGHDATLECSDCGGSTCEIHLLTCDACGVKICSDCAAFYGYGLALCETEECNSNQKSARQTLKETYYNAKNRAWKPKSPIAHWFTDYLKIYILSCIYFSIITVIITGIYITFLSYYLPLVDDPFSWDSRINDLGQAFFSAIAMGPIVYPVWFAHIIIDLIIIPTPILADNLSTEMLDALQPVLWGIGFFFMFIYFRALRKRRYLS